jgi:hypothetical protein
VHRTLGSRSSVLLNVRAVSAFGLVIGVLLTAEVPMPVGLCGWAHRAVLSSEDRQSIRLC